MDIQDKDYKGRMSPTFRSPVERMNRVMNEQMNAVWALNDEFDGFHTTLGRDLHGVIIRAQCTNIDQERDSSDNRCWISHYHELVFIDIDTMTAQYL